MAFRCAFLAILAAGTAIGPAMAQAQDVNQIAAKFGALESVGDVSLSPDGTKIAFVAPAPDGGNVLYIADMTTGGSPRRIINSTGTRQSLEWCSFATDTRLVCQVAAIFDSAGVLLGASRLVALNVDGSGMAMISNGENSRSLGSAQFGGSILDWDLPGKPGHVLMARPYVPEVSTGTRMSSDKRGLGVDAVNLADMRRSVVEQPRETAVRYVSDGKGTIRLMATRGRETSGYQRTTINYLYRKAGSRDWEPLNQLKLDASGSYVGFEPLAVDSTKDVTYGFDDNKGFQALYSLSLDGLAKRELLLSRPDVDVDGLVRIGRDRRVVGASYALERRTVEFFDPELKRLGSALGRALPGKPSIGFVDASLDESKLLMIASSDVDPGKFYLYDKVSKRLEEVIAIRGQLAGMQMSEMKPIVFPAADGTQIPAYLTLPPGSNGKGLPAIVMPHGGPSARDEWGFDWLVQFYTARGFAVIQPNYRGSSGYGSAWYAKNGFQSWRIAIGDVNDAGRYLLSQGIAAPGKLAIVGWSYGGYAALQSSVLDADLFKAIVAIAPVTDLEQLRQDAAKYTNFKVVDAFIGQGPHVHQASPARHAAMIKAPVLLFHGDKDLNVGVGASRLMADKLKEARKSVEYVEFQGLDHQLPSAAARTRMLADSDAFLRKNLGLPAN